jgi:transcription elongation factor GreA
MKKEKNMAEKTYPMTLEEKEKLEKELEELKLVRRPEIEMEQNYE